MSPVIRTAGDKRTKAVIGFSRKSTSPTSTLEASAPGGIFFMKFMSTCGNIKGEDLGVNLLIWKYFTKLLSGGNDRSPDMCRKSERKQQQGIEKQ